MPRLGHTASPFEEIIRVSDLTAGMDLQEHPALLRSDQAVVLVEWDLNQPGRLRTRPGFVNFIEDDPPIAPEFLGGIRVYLRLQAPFTLLGGRIGATGSIWRPTDSGNLGAPVVTLLDELAPLFFTYDPQIIAYFNGINTPHKSQNGITWTRLGQTQPSSPSLALIAGGTLIPGNTYEIVITWRENVATPPLLHEGPPSAAVTSVPTTGNQTIRVTRPGVPGGQGINEWVIYARNVTAGESVHRRVAIVPIATTTFDITTNVWFPNGVPAPFGNDAPPIFPFATYWNGRWWAFSPERPNALRFSNLFDGQSWPGTNEVELPFERGDVGTALIPYGDTLVIFGNHSIGLLIGETATELTFRLLPHVHSGAFGPEAAKVVEGTIVHASASGIHLFDGSSDRELNQAFADHWQELLRQVTTDDLYNTRMVFDFIRHELRITNPVLPALPEGMISLGAGEWILYTQRMRASGDPAWALTNRPTAGYIFWDGNETLAANRGKLLRADSRSWDSTALGAPVSRLWLENMGSQIIEVLDESGGAGGSGSLFFLTFDAEVGITADVGGIDTPAVLVAGYIGPTFNTGFLTTRQLAFWGEAAVFGGSLNFQPFAVVDRLGLQVVNFGDAPEEALPYGAAISYGTPTRIYGAGASIVKGVQPFFLTLPLEAEGTSFSVELVYAGNNTFELHSYSWGIVEEPAPRWIVHHTGVGV